MEESDAGLNPLLSLASQPLHKKGRVWYDAVTRVVLFPRNPGEHEYANFVAAA